MSIQPEPTRNVPTLVRTLLGWLLPPLLILLAVSAISTHRYAAHLAESERDLVLGEIADDLNDSAYAALNRDGRIDPHSLTLQLIVNDSRDHRYFAIYNSGGLLLAGDPRLPRIELGPHVSDRAVFRYISLDGNPLRLATLKGDQAELPGYEILVAETMVRRDHLALHLNRVVLIPQAAVILLTIPLVLFGVKKGLRPLDTLRQRITSRSPQELKELFTQDTPRELQPVVTALNELLSRVRAAQDEQRRFIADAAHQIKTPLASLKAEIDLALSDPTYACAQPVLKRLGDASNRLSHLIQQLLALAHSETHDGKNLALLDLTELAKEITGDYVPIANTRDIDLGYEGTHHTIPIRGNAVLIREAMKNLVENAIKFTPDSGTITISVNDSPPRVSVADSGPGVPETQLAFIFQRFHRAHDLTATEGSGLGLAIVKEIARSHGARISVGRSTLGGALFTLQFQDQGASLS